MILERIGLTLEIYANRGEGLVFRILGFSDGLRGREEQKPDRRNFATKKAHTGAVRRYLDGYKEGSATRERDLQTDEQTKRRTA